MTLIDPTRIRAAEKGIKFLNLQDPGDPVEAALFYDKEGADKVSINTAATKEPELPASNSRGYTASESGPINWARSNSFPIICTCHHHKPATQIIYCHLFIKDTLN